MKKLLRGRKQESYQDAVEGYRVEPEEAKTLISCPWREVEGVWRAKKME